MQPGTVTVQDYHTLNANVFGLLGAAIGQRWCVSLPGTQMDHPKFPHTRSAAAASSAAVSASGTLALCTRVSGLLAWLVSRFNFSKMSSLRDFSSHSAVMHWTGVGVPGQCHTCTHAHIAGIRAHGPLSGHLSGRQPLLINPLPSGPDQ